MFINRDLGIPSKKKEERPRELKDTCIIIFTCMVHDQFTGQRNMQLIKVNFRLCCLWDMMSLTYVEKR